MKNLPSLWDLIDKYKVSIIFGLVGAVLIGLGFLIPRLNLFQPEPVFESAAQSQTQEPLEIKVDISGAVTKPDVYQLADGSRIEDAIDAAGGLNASADKDWVSHTGPSTLLCCHSTQRVSSGCSVLLINFTLSIRLYSCSSSEHARQFPPLAHPD